MYWTLERWWGAHSGFNDCRHAKLTWVCNPLFNSPLERPGNFQHLLTPATRLILKTSYQIHKLAVINLRPGLQCNNVCWGWQIHASCVCGARLNRDGWTEPISCSLPWKWPISRPFELGNLRWVFWHAKFRVWEKKSRREYQIISRVN